MCSTGSSCVVFRQERPFKILGLQQVAIGALDKAVSAHGW